MNNLKINTDVINSKILVIEDNEDVQENIKELLELTGYSVITAGNGKEGISKALEDKPDLILCDIMMPELDGYGALRILSNHPSTMDIPFIFLTAKSEKEDFRKGMGLGADDYITKPYDDVQLLDTIEIRLNKKTYIKRSFPNSGKGLQKFIDEAVAKKEFENLVLHREIRSYRKKDIVFEFGHYPAWLYFVESGTLKSYRVNEFGKELTTNIYKSGDFFGYIPILRGEKYTDNVSAIEDSQVKLIPIEDFTLLLFNNREFSAMFIKILSSQIEFSEQQLLDLAYSSVRKRVANALLKFSESKGVTMMAILRDDIASLAGTAKETTIRTLSDFKSEGIISIDDNKIEFLEIDKLINMPQ